MIILDHLASIVVTTEAIKALVKFQLMQWGGETHSLDVTSPGDILLLVCSYACSYFACNNKLTYFYVPFRLL